VAGPESPVEVVGPLETANNFIEGDNLQTKKMLVLQGQALAKLVEG
jgi:hypothetical protein